MKKYKPINSKSKKSTHAFCFYLIEILFYFIICLFVKMNFHLNVT